MEIKQLEPKDKVLTFFGEIKSTTVENTIKDIVQINLADRDYINKGPQSQGTPLYRRRWRQSRGDRPHRDHAADGVHRPAQTVRTTDVLAEMRRRLLR